MDEMRCLFHVHSSYSFDSFLRPKTIVDYAIKKDFHILSITDHNTIAGSVAAKKYNPSSDLSIIIGAEYATDKGDIIGLFLNSEISSHTGNEVIDEIKAQGGIVVLPHPFKGRGFDPELIRRVDLIETYNARVLVQGNQAAEELARKMGKQTIAGGDVHFLSEAGLTEVIFETSGHQECLKQLVLEGKRKVIYKTHSKQNYYEMASQAIKAYKLRDTRLLALMMWRFAKGCWTKLHR